MDLFDKYLGEAKKVTKATIKSILKQVKADKFSGDIETDSTTIAVWYDLDNEKEAEKLVKAIVKKLPAATTTRDGYKFLIYWKGQPTDLSRVNVR